MVKQLISHIQKNPIDYHKQLSILKSYKSKLFHIVEGILWKDAKSTPEGYYGKQLNVTAT